MWDRDVYLVQFRLHAYTTHMGPARPQSVNKISFTYLIIYHRYFFWTFKIKNVETLFSILLKHFQHRIYLYMTYS